MRRKGKRRRIEEVVEVIEDACGQSPPPPALLDVPITAKRCGQTSAKVLDHVFPQPLWTPFGEMWGRVKKTRGRKKEGVGVGVGSLGSSVTSVSLLVRGCSPGTRAKSCWLYHSALQRDACRAPWPIEPHGPASTLDRKSLLRCEPWTGGRLSH